ncbi:MAG: glucose-6-phosphate dehydrogenase assembly protein OpcA [Halothece sp.]
MMTQSPPLLSLQSPKDVSIEEIEAELNQIWQANRTGDEGTIATRATTFTMVIYESQETQQLLAALGFYQGPIDGIVGSDTVEAIKAAQKAYGFEETGNPTREFLDHLRSAYQEAQQQPGFGNHQKYVYDGDGSAIADAIAAANPCRIITLYPTAGEDEGVSAQVSAYCPIQKQGSNSLVCCEYINLTGTAEALERIGGMVSALMVSELPKFIWWKATPNPEYGLFQRLSENSDIIIIDSSTFADPEGELECIGKLLSEGMVFADLNWRRLAAWQELTAEAFDPPERRSALKEVDRVTIDYEKGNPAQTLMFLGWLASRLQWQPTSYEYEGGDYDIRRVKFLNDEQKEVEAELAGIPTEAGDIPGDLISLRLSSTNLEADCCTVLCSETTGCMRMEAGGGAQSCRIQQVTPLFDQKTEQLLTKQLQRWGREVLYEESMKLTYEMLKLRA